MTLAAGDRLGRYEIRTQLGSGGMGEVYRAVDTTLDRDVAVKVLPDGVAGDEQKLERFRLEARAVAALSHPNILEIHDFGEHEGVQYAVSELLDGQTLRDRIPATGMAWQRVVEIGADIADALAAAHGKGIVHRDVKPENVFITSTGRVKVLDFGLARVHELTTPEAPTGVVLDGDTQVGSVVGTLGYLAPEQVTGGNVDGRSDVFALGCVLYEMVTGRSAFRRAMPAESLWATLKEDPPLPSSVGALLPADLERVISRCLEKEPRARFQSAADLAFALRAVASGSAPAVGIIPRPTARRRRWGLAIAAAFVVAAVMAGLYLWPQVRDVVAPPELDPKRVAVLPFENRTGVPELDVIGPTVADWLTQDLPEPVDLDMVAGSTAVAAVARVGTGPGAALDVARELGAGTLVTGAYYRQADQLSIKAEIADVTTGDLVHSIGPESGPLDDPMAAIEPLRQRVLGALAATDPRFAPFAPPTLDAYREVMAGVEVWQERPEVGIEHFRRAAELDPGYVPARLLIVHTLFDGLRRFDEGRAELAELASWRHLMGSFDRLCVDCVVLLRAQRYEEAIPLLRELVELDPDNPLISNGLVQALASTNRPRQAIAVFERMEEPQKGGLGQVFSACMALHLLGEHERELEVAQDALASFPTLGGDFRWGLLTNAVVALAAMGRSSEASVLIEKIRGDPDAANVYGGSEASRVWVAWQAAAELAAHGWPEEGRRIAEEALERSAPNETQPPWTRWCLALLMLQVDRVDDARAVLDDLVSENPDELYIVGLWAATAALVGDREAAEEGLRRIDELSGPFSFGQDHYWRACVAAQLGDLEGAMENLRAALRDGQQFNLTFHRNPFLDPLHGYPPFEDFLEPKG